MANQGKKNDAAAAENAKKVDAAILKVQNTCSHTNTYTDGTSCKPVKICNYPLEYEKAAPTQKTNRVCGKPVACKGTQFEVAPVSLFGDRKCTDRVKCTAKQWRYRIGGPFENDSCKDLTACKVW